MHLPSIVCTALSSLSVTPLKICEADLVGAITNMPIDLCQNILVWLSNKIVSLDLASFSEMIENHCC